MNSPRDDARAWLARASTRASRYPAGRTGAGRVGALGSGPTPGTGSITIGADACGDSTGAATTGMTGTRAGCAGCAGWGAGATGTLGAAVGGAGLGA